MKSLRLWLFPLVLFPVVNASLRGGDDSAIPKSNVSGFVFSLLPKSLQKRPVVDFNAITEMTAAGRRISRPTADKPAYFTAYPSGYVQLGEGASANEHPPMPAQLETVMQKALAISHYLPAHLPEHPPTLLIIYYWGSYTMNTFDGQEVADEMAAEEANPDAIPPMDGDKSAEELLPAILGDLRKQKELFERASLVGGDKFAQELAQVVQDEIRIADVDVSASRTAAIMGNQATNFAAVTSPLQRFRNRDPQISRMIDETFSSCYFVVVSAFDYQSVAASTKRLLWRTKMTVNSLGVSMLDTIPPLIANGGDFFGRDMKTTVTRSERITTEGRVDVGVPTVIDEPAATPSKEKPKR
jgi:hypothetical protein